MRYRLHGLRLGMALMISGLAMSALARDFTINIPKRTQPTPVQKLNLDGVRAVKKHDLAKAEKLFYKAYLIDPDDPFTLNNLGYISELQGKVDRAQKYYQLASRENSETVIAESSVPQLEGHPLTGVTSAYESRELQVNRGNVEAMALLQHGRLEDAEKVLQNTLTLDPQNPFTLNNLGLVMEAEGNLDQAVRYYTHAASLHSSQSVVVALDPRVRGKAISEVAGNNAIALQTRMNTERTVDARVARLNAQGVTALNHNDSGKARDYFSQAYDLDSKNAFALNNIGYVAEMDGDQETANDFYAAAALAPESGSRVSLASRQDAEGLRLGDVASNNDQLTQQNLVALQAVRRRQTGPIQLRRRNNSPVTEPQGTSPEPNATQPERQRLPVDNAPVDNSPVPQAPQH
jgi:Flp pilus assembly protein TadD